VFSFCLVEIVGMSEVKNILGFQFEPLRKPKIIRGDKPGSDSDSSWTTIEESEEEVAGEMRFARCREPVHIWCKCKNCQSMPTEDECTCCHELDSHQLFEIQGWKQKMLINYFYRQNISLKFNLEVFDVHFSF